MLPISGIGLAVTATPDSHHVMIHQRADSSGADEWLCSDCGRHFIVRWVPDFEQFVVTAGDHTVSHSGSQHGIVRAGPPRAAGVPDEDPPRAPSPEWQRWMRAHGIVWDDGC